MISATIVFCRDTFGLYSDQLGTDVIVNTNSETSTLTQRNNDQRLLIKFMSRSLKYLAIRLTGTTSKGIFVLYDIKSG